MTPLRVAFVAPSLGILGGQAVQADRLLQAWKDDPDVAAWLQEKGVRLLGLDLPSVDLIDAKVLQNHHALGRAGIWIVESLDLSEVAAGLYDFAAFPLKISGGDGAPVRAVLWRDAK